MCSFCLTYVPRYNALEVHPCCSRCQNVLLVEAWISFRIWIDHICLSVHPLMGTWVGSTQALVNNVATDMSGQISIWVPAFSSFGYTYPEVEGLHHMAILSFNFWGISVLFSPVAVLFNISTSNVHYWLNLSFVFDMLLSFKIQLHFLWDIKYGPLLSLT